MRRTRPVPALLVTLLVTLAVPVGALAQEAGTPGSGTADALLAALARVPDTAAVRQNAVSWLDQAAAVATRPALLDQPRAQMSKRCWPRTMRRVSSGWRRCRAPAAAVNPEVLAGVMSATRWPAELGFDFTDIDQHVTFGLPPTDGSVLQGTFDPAAVSAAFEARGYTATAEDEHTLLCGPTGCEGGMAVDLAAADPGLPFGRQLGRSEPIAVSTTES